MGTKEPRASFDVASSRNQEEVNAKRGERLAREVWKPALPAGKTHDVRHCDTGKAMRHIMDLSVPVSERVPDGIAHEGHAELARALFTHRNPGDWSASMPRFALTALQERRDETAALFISRPETTFAGGLGEEMLFLSMYHHLPNAFDAVLARNEVDVDLPNAHRLAPLTLAVMKNGDREAQNHMRDALLARCDISKSGPALDMAALNMDVESVNAFLKYNPPPEMRMAALALVSKRRANHHEDPACRALSDAITNALETGMAQPVPDISKFKAPPSRLFTSAAEKPAGDARAAPVAAVPAPPPQPAALLMSSGGPQ